MVLRARMRLLRGLLPLVLVLAAAGCRSISIDTDHDKSFDFKRLRTFDYLAAPTSARTAQTDPSLLDMIAAELTARGLQPTKQNPDLLIAVHRSIEGQLNTRGFGYEEIGGRLHPYTYQEGSLVVDLIDATSKRTVWRGTAQGAFKFSEDPAELRRMLADVLRDMFADFPPS